MTFEGFSKEDFDVFLIEGLEPRMEALRERIQPKFKAIGEELTDELSSKLGNEMFLHIAKHARRTTNPPKDTWLAICDNKRGYKKHPHFQVGVFDDHVFVWLAYIYELPNKSEMAQTLLAHLDDIKHATPENYLVSLDHMKKEAESLKTLNLEGALERFRDVKKAEFLIGRHFAADDPILREGEQFVNVVKETFETLLPIYKLSHH